MHAHIWTIADVWATVRKLSPPIRCHRSHEIDRMRLSSAHVDAIRSLISLPMRNRNCFFFRFIYVWIAILETCNFNRKIWRSIGDQFFYLKKNRLFIFICHFIMTRILFSDFSLYKYISFTFQVGIGIFVAQNREAHWAALRNSSTMWVPARNLHRFDRSKCLSADKCSGCSHLLQSLAPPTKSNRVEILWEDI